jgi:hypothetical protein
MGVIGRCSSLDKECFDSQGFMQSFFSTEAIHVQWTTGPLNG